MEKLDINDTPPKPPLSPTQIFLGVVLVWAVLGQLPVTVAGIDSAGAFGDQFGAVNALFSGLALAGLLWTIWQQRKEIWLTQRQLILLKDDQEKARELQTVVGVLNASEGMRLQFLERCEAASGESRARLEVHLRLHEAAVTGCLSHLMNRLPEMIQENMREPAEAARKLDD